MQEKNPNYAKNILHELRDHYRFRTYGELATFLGVKESTLSSWKNRNVVDADLIFAKCEGISYEWIKTLKPPMFNIGAEEQGGYQVTREIRRVNSDEEELLEMLREYPAFRDEIMKLPGLRKSQQMKKVGEMLEKLEDLE